MGGLKTIIGGKIGAFTDMCEATRQQAYDDMVEHANRWVQMRLLGCNMTLLILVKAAQKSFVSAQR